MNIIYNLIGDSGIFISAPPTLIGANETINIRFIGAPKGATAVIKSGNSSSYIEVIDEVINISKEFIAKNVAQGLFSMPVSVITSERPLRKWACEDLGLVRIGDRILVFPNYEQTRQKLSELSVLAGTLSKKVSSLELKMKTVDDKVSKFVGGDITE